MKRSVIVIDDEDTVYLFSEFLGEKDIIVGNGYDSIIAIKLYKEKNLTLY